MATERTSHRAWPSVPRHLRRGVRVAAVGRVQRDCVARGHDAAGGSSRHERLVAYAVRARQGRSAQLPMVLQRPGDRRRHAQRAGIRGGAGSQRRPVHGQAHQPLRRGHQFAGKRGGALRHQPGHHRRGTHCARPVAGSLRAGNAGHLHRRAGGGLLFRKLGRRCQRRHGANHRHRR